MNRRKTPYITMFVIFIITLLFIFAYDKVSIVFDMFAPVLYAAVIAYLLDGIVRFFMRRLKMKRWVSVAVTMVLVLLVCGITVYYTIPFLVATVVDLVQYVSGLLTKHETGIYNALANVAQYFDFDLETLWNFDITKIDKNLLDTLNNTFQGIYGLAVGTVTRFGASVIEIFTSFVLAIYMLIEKEDLLKRCKKIISAVIPEGRVKYVLGSFTMANDVFKRFIIGKSVDSFIIGVLMIICFGIFGIEYGVVFGILGGVGNMIPYFGPIISAIPVVLILLIINPWHAMVALIIILVIQQLDSHIIGPKVLSDNIGVSPFWILFSVTVCGIAGGLMGMIVGVPLVVVIKNIIEDYADRRLAKRESKKAIVAKEKAEVGANAKEQ